MGVGADDRGECGVWFGPVGQECLDKRLAGSVAPRSAAPAARRPTLLTLARWPAGVRCGLGRRSARGDRADSRMRRSQQAPPTHQMMLVYEADVSPSRCPGLTVRYGRRTPVLPTVLGKIAVALARRSGAPARPVVIDPGRDCNVRAVAVQKLSGLL